MAQISSYPIVDPQLGDKVLGSNTVDSLGAPVQGNPTVQYTLSSVKATVDQQFIQQLTSSSNNNPNAGIVAQQEVSGANAAYDIKFGAADATSPNVTIDLNGKVTFLTKGTYYITQEYYLSAAAGNSLFFLFRAYQDSLSQVGETHVEKFVVQSSVDRKKIVIKQMVNVTSGTYYVFQMLRDSGGSSTAGKLVQILNNNSWTTTANAQLTISKLI